MGAMRIDLIVCVNAGNTYKIHTKMNVKIHMKEKTNLEKHFFCTYCQIGTADSLSTFKTELKTFHFLFSLCTFEH